MISYNIERNERGEVTVTLNGHFKSITEAMKLVELVESMPSKYTPFQQQLIAYMQSGQKLMAVKTYKDATGEGLKESKDYVEDLYEKYVRDK